MSSFSQAERQLRDAVADGVFPGAVAEAGTLDGPVWSCATGHLTLGQNSPAVTAETIFDLASLTKVVATTTIAMRQIDAGVTPLDLRVGDALTGWRGDDRRQVTVRDLLAHCSGLTAHLPFYRDHADRAEFEASVCQLPLEYPPRTRSVYSDLGFILLGFILSDRHPDGAGLAEQFAHFAAERGWGEIGYHPPASWRPRTAPTEQDPWRGRTLVAEVHDENAWALGGAAGHAGLFGTAAAVSAFARDILRAFNGDATIASPATFETFCRCTDVPGSSRALGWDTMRPTSSCGERLSPRSIGHTGFTGTSLWIDPDAGLSIVLLTNRVHPSRENDAILQFRPGFHSAVHAAVTHPCS
ncbi:MAG: beta-lactamase family protein [Acidobacteria bacterium]|nr:beta-lactamase family protein [Acidobacteriota bacterium]